MYRSEEPADQAEAIMIKGQEPCISGQNTKKRTQETGVGNVWKGLDFDPLNGDDPGGRSGVTGCRDKAWVVGRADHTEYKNTEDVEDEDTDPDTADSERDVLGRIVGFSGGHSENLGSQEGVSSIDQDRPETSKTTRRPGNFVVLDESARVMLCGTESVILLAVVQKST